MAEQENDDPVMDGARPEGKYSLGRPAKDAYTRIETTTRRQAVVDMGRMMAELTIPSVFPPQGYMPGDDIPGNNQSIGAQCVNNLASALMFMAFPPGQPFCRFDPVVQKMTKEIAQNPDLYGKVQLALSQLEVVHRKKASTTPLATAWVGYTKALLVGGNALWKHIEIDSPTFHLPTDYAVKRDSGGHPLVTIHKECVSVMDLEEDVQAILEGERDEDSQKVDEWEETADIYSVCQLHGYGKHRHWCYWQETEKGTLLPGTEMETDYDDCPMWPGWLIPRYGHSWGTGYCEEYRGDLYTVEANASALNDGAAAAGFNITFVKPGSRTSLRQLQKAANLSFLSGSAEDVTTLKSEKAGDFTFVAGNFERASRRLGAAFLLQSAVRRDGERVTAEEVQRVGQELDKAMGGLYTERAQGDQRRMVMRFIRLHEQDDSSVPDLPVGVVNVEVVTGVDAMGRSIENQTLREFGAELKEVFGDAAAQILNLSDYANRLAASKGIKPDGLVKSAELIAQETAQAQQQAQGADVMSKAAGPVSGAMAKGMMDRMNQPPPDEQVH